MKKSAVFIVAAGLAGVAFADYDGLVIAKGEEVVISTNAFYSSIKVNGSLTVKDGKFAETGVLKVSNYVPGGTRTLPLTFTDTVASTSFAGWQVYIDGQYRKDWSLSFDGSELTLLPPELMLLIR